MRKSPNEMGCRRPCVVRCLSLLTRTRTIYTGTIRRIDAGVAYVEVDGYPGHHSGVALRKLHCEGAGEVQASGPVGVRWKDVTP